MTTSSLCWVAAISIGKIELPVPTILSRIAGPGELFDLAPTFEPARETHAGQRAALLVQSAAAVMQHLDQWSSTELSLE